MAGNNEFFEALTMLEHERGITAEYLIEKIRAAIVIAVKKNYDVEDDNVSVEIDPATGKFNVALIQEVVDDDDWETDCGSEISLSNASCRSGTIEQSVNENEYGSLVLRFETVFHYLVLHFCSLLYQPLPLRFFSGHLETRHLESR